MLSKVPWRKLDADYMNNEVYFDFVERVDAILDAQENVISAEVRRPCGHHSPLKVADVLSFLIFCFSLSSFHIFACLPLAGLRRGSVDVLPVRHA
jgi:hypothetical protein